MKKIINDFLLMLQFLTRIPINKSLDCEMDNFRRGAMFLPIVGAIIGLIQWILYYLLIKVLPAGIVAVILIAAGIILTGGLHIDGLGDSCDGFYAFKGKDRIIEIMKDSRIGTYACVAIVIDILIRFSSLEYIFHNFNSFIIIAVPVIGRFSIVLLSYIGKPAKSTGSGNLFIGNVKIIELIVVSIMTIIIEIGLLGLKSGVILFLLGILLTYINNLYCNKKINGITGDLLGANNEIIEIFSLIIFMTIR